jgi:hypothetical protein
MILAKMTDVGIKKMAPSKIPFTLYDPTIPTMRILALNTQAAPIGLWFCSNFPAIPATTRKQEDVTVTK